MVHNALAIKVNNHHFHSYCCLVLGQLYFGEFFNRFPYIQVWQKPLKSSFITYMLICTTYLCVTEQYRFFNTVILKSDFFCYESIRCSICAGLVIT